MSLEILAAWGRISRRRENDRAIIEAASRRSVTYGELEAHGNKWLTHHAGNPAALQGRTVVFSVANGIGWFEIFLGLLKAGAVIVPLDAAEPAAAQRKMAETLRADFWWDGVKLIALADGKKARDRRTCLIKLTSGTTGAPRALCFTGAQLLADAHQVTTTMGITSLDLNYALIPFGHSYGLGNLTLPLLTKGVSLVCGISPLPHAIAGDFAQWSPTVFPGVPAMWRALAASDLRLKSLRLGISAGAPLPSEVARNFLSRFGRKLHSFYGSSETGGIAYDRTGQTTLEGKVGRALKGVTLTIRSRARLEVQSPAVFTQGNRRRTKHSGTWLMADAVTLNSLGDVAVIGRRGKTVKVAGRRVNLGEVTARLRRVNGVEEAWVGIRGETEPILAAVVVTKLSIPALRTVLHSDTAAWKIPKKWIVLGALPLTERGKPNVRALQALIART